MPTSSLEFWWALAIGTLVVLSLTVIIIATVVVSHRRQVESQRERLEVLRESERRYRTLVESMEEAVFVADAAGRILFVNTRFTQLMDSTQDTMIGKTLTDLFPGEGASRLMNCLNRVFTLGKAGDTEHRFETSDSSYWFETALVPQYDRDKKMVSVLGILRDTTERRQMEDQLKELVTTLKSQQETLKALSSEVIRAQEAERKRISWELHDEIGQALTAISLNLQIIRQQQTGEGEELTRRVTDCRELVQKTMEDIHRFSYELHPSMLEDLGLLPAIRSHARTFMERTGIDVRIHGTRSMEKLDSEMKTVLYRAFQEALNNVSKHADARLVDIDISKQKGIISLRVVDDGKGFDPTDLATTERRKRGLGLQGIHERVALVGGHLSLVSAPGAGTTLRVEIPYGEA